MSTSTGVDSTAGGAVSSDGLRRILPNRSIRVQGSVRIGTRRPLLQRLVTIPRFTQRGKRATLRPVQTSYRIGTRST
jgi:hypothetical protein